MMELIFVIIVIGILSAVFIPRFGQNKLSQAANQLISNIRYTQHLALMDDEYNATNPNWYQNRWTIMNPFFKTSKSSFLIPPFYDTNGNSFAPLGSKLFIA